VVEQQSAVVEQDSGAEVGQQQVEAVPHRSHLGEVV
jgi:hypothetical protein